MALVDDVRFYRALIAADEMTRADAINALVEDTDGRLTEFGAADLLDNWQIPA